MTKAIKLILLAYSILAYSSDILICQVRDSKLDINISIIEGYGELDYDHRNIEPSYFLVMHTKEEYSQFNCEIKYLANIHRDTIDIVINGVSCPSVQFHAFGPANAHYKLPISEGFYLININNNGVTNKYKLTMDDEKLEFQQCDSLENKGNNLLLWRFPKMSFAFIAEMSQDKFDALDKMINDSLDLSQIEIKDKGNWPLRENPPRIIDSESLVKFYRYKSEDDYNKIDEILDSFMKKQDKYLKISFMNWKNKIFISKPLSYY
ncbi:MAG: hypothetical protein IPM56_01390 [Ignavibacteriales bacterium]|nr:MAG: hypothetical protein IPM56_01390 [Ignavibacteriales bacterium]